MTTIMTPAIAMMAPIRFLNQPVVKEGIKNIAGAVTFAFGIIEIYDICQIARGRKISTEASAQSPRWKQIATKVTIVCAKVSLILSAGTSRPGIFIISTIMGKLFTTAQLERAFGPNARFAVNPWHPRHVVSIVAVILALPSVAQSAFKGASWACKKIRQCQEGTKRKQSEQWLTDSKIRLMALFNTITSRPVLHLGNRLCRFAVRH